MVFRKLEKEALQIQTPPEIADIVRDKAHRDRTSISQAATELICLAIGHDPRNFGIEAGGRRPTTAA